MHRHILHNESILDSAVPCLRPGQAGLLAGWGVFSTIRVRRGVLFEFERHYARMQRDAENMRVPMPDSVWLQDRLSALIASNGAHDCTLRVVVVRNTGSVWAGPAEQDFDVVGLTADLADWGDSVRLGVVHHGRDSQSRFAGAKVTSWGANLTWYEEAHLSGFDEVILLNEREEVCECTSANIFAVQGQQVWTPPLSSGCLPGVTRELLLEVIRIDGFRVLERELTLTDLECSDEVFITSTTRDLLPVSTIEGRSIGKQTVVCERYREEFQKHIEDYTNAHSKRGEAA